MDLGEQDTRRHDRMVFRDLLEDHAALQPDALYASFPATGDQWTWAVADRKANQAANAFAGIGVKQGDRVAVLSANSAELLQALFGATKLGAVYTPLNTGFRGAILRHVVDLAEPALLVCEAELLDRVLDLPENGPVHTVAVVGPPDPATLLRAEARFRVVDFHMLVERGATSPPPPVALRFWDPYGVIFTSGTTGPSKGVLSSYSQLFSMVEHPMLAISNPDDVFLVDLPLFHVGALLTFATTLYLGARIVVLPRVQINGYWDRIREHGVTHVTFLEQIANWLWKQPARSDDADNPLRRVLIGRFPVGFDAWCDRFGVHEYYGYFNMTEISSPLMTGLNPKNRLGTGRARPGVQLRLVDENDLEVEVGSPGELVIRTDRPWELNLGYLKMPELTAQAWRNGWFHTGDVFRRDADNWFYFLDRVKDSLRRNGENISSFEVEREIVDHDAIMECAVVGVPGEDENDEVAAYVILVPGATLPPEELIEFLRPRLPYFAIPRYVVRVDSLPRNTTQKVLKHELRSTGLPDGAWDRVAHGIAVGRKL